MDNEEQLKKQTGHVLLDNKPRPIFISELPEFQKQAYSYLVRALTDPEGNSDESSKKQISAAGWFDYIQPWSQENKAGVRMDILTQVIENGPTLASAFNEAEINTMIARGFIVGVAVDFQFHHVAATVLGGMVYRLHNGRAKTLSDAYVERTKQLRETQNG